MLGEQQPERPGVHVPLAEDPQAMTISLDGSGRSYAA